MHEIQNIHHANNTASYGSYAGLKGLIEILETGAQLSVIFDNASTVQKNMLLDAFPQQTYNYCAQDIHMQRELATNCTPEHMMYLGYRLTVVLRNATFTQQFDLHNEYDYIDYTPSIQEITGNYLPVQRFTTVAFI